MGFSDILATVLPVFLVMAVGRLLVLWQLLDQQFLYQGNRLLYWVALPALLAIGGNCRRQQLQSDLGRMGLATAIKLAWMPLAAWWLLKTLGVTGTDFGVGVLLAGTPTATATYVMAQELGGDTRLAGAIVVLTTVLAALSYTLLFYFLKT